MIWEKRSTWVPRRDTLDWCSDEPWIKYSIYIDKKEEIMLGKEHNILKVKTWITILGWMIIIIVTKCETFCSKYFISTTLFCHQSFSYKCKNKSHREVCDFFRKELRTRYRELFTQFIFFVEMTKYKTCWL